MNVNQFNQRNSETYKNSSNAQMFTIIEPGGISANCSSQFIGIQEHTHAL